MLASLHRIDEDFYEFQPCFWPFANDFEEGGSQSLDVTFPDEDIWKKFELLPTPPRSPSRVGEIRTFIPSIDDKLRIVTQDIIITDPENAIKTNMEIKLELEKALIRDCMWGGGGSDAVKSRISATTQTAGNGKIDEPEVNFDCVSPSSVLPCRPLVDHLDYAAVAPPPPSIPNPIPTPPSSACCSSESDEEIDVVTVGSAAAAAAAIANVRPKKRPIVLKQLAPPPTSQIRIKTDSAPVAATAPPSAKKPRISSAPTSPLRRAIPSANQQPQSRRHSYCGKNRRSSLCSRGRDDSDENDIDLKRNTHNVLERKRRNDLKSSFHNLRLHVPDIRDNEKTPKVVILKKAAEHVRQARNRLERFNEILEGEKRRNALLKMKLAALNQGKSVKS